MTNLSILICSLERRRKYLNLLLKRLNPQLTQEIELIIDTDDGSRTIGDKRNWLLQSATGKYICFIDDDDMVSENYISKILKATESDPDCVGFKVQRNVDGKYVGFAIHSLSVTHWHVELNPENAKEKIFFRTPNHLNPIKRNIALKVGFIPKNHGEDATYAHAIRPMLSSEVFIDQMIYSYQFQTKKI